MGINISYPYKGVRVSWFAYHPAKHGPKEKDGQWEEASLRFMAVLDSFCDVTELYRDQQVHSETVGGEAWKKEVMSLYTAIERGENKDIYQLEALAEQIFDVSDKTAQRMLPYHKEIKERAVLISAEDHGLSIDRHIPASSIIQRGWGA